MTALGFFFDSEVIGVLPQTVVLGLSSQQYGPFVVEMVHVLQLSLPYQAGESVEPSEAEEVEPHASTWVERFQPQTYLELLSDEVHMQISSMRMNGARPVTTSGQIRHRTYRPGADADFKKIPFGKAGKPKEDILKDAVDEEGRPKQLVALLAGAPGLGKTTLAHVIARHAGYHVVEMNASDDRSPAHFAETLERATQMQSVLGASRRPNCLVVDEIDGAPQVSVDLLVDFVLGKGLKGEGGKGRKGKARAVVQQRPIVCICNDLYVPALRLLRQHALVLQFPPTLPARLAQRMQEIARTQQMEADLTALLTLCEKAENDIRSCITTLEFLSRHLRRRLLRPGDVHGLNVGRKDFHKSLFGVWHDIFHVPRANK
ncbi:unnamed protein product, partial [Darwinula stevensoni]